MAARSIWNGTVTFGLVNVPVKLFTATENKSVSFNEVHASDPVYFDRSYYVGAGDDKDAYALLHEALRKSGRAGIGRFTFHDREYLIAAQALDDVIPLHTLRFHDELVATDDLELPGGRK